MRVSLHSIGWWIAGVCAVWLVGVTVRGAGAVVCVLQGRALRGSLDWLQ
ncbi:hypothetical protein [Xylella fastidiosa]|uniref:Uncharacterized protein n=1 Tax=Xylella fastidiosa subsp. sandyi Ann-1 TaxID=155920 RepID=A0A060HDZ0_XYLFS|nr:hypothetical protein [Xylella fastidiosa]AIC11157.1 hypothetical protein D934_05475 [Xylella fastidiosa subsp. sandyi Ann-1]UIX80193.1 hypothetical protein LZ756_06620 [Xylella fastidiosa subsp. sandyi]